VGLPWLLSFAITKAGTRPGERDRTDTPAAEGATFEQIAFASADGNTLSGWYLPARGEQRVTIILTHGLFRSRYEMLERGLDLWRAGYAVLLYDLRRHGQSKAEFSSIGFYERRDVEAAFRFVRGRAPEHRIVLMGVSMGAAATLLAASEIQDEKLLAVVAESSFLSFEDTVRHHISLVRLPPRLHGGGIRIPTFPFAPLLIKFTAWRLNFAADDYDLLPAVRKIARPILFIGGAKDVRMPNATVLEPLYRAAQDARKGKFIVAGATHGHAYDESPEATLKPSQTFWRRSNHRRDVETASAPGAYQMLSGRKAATSDLPVRTSDEDFQKYSCACVRHRLLSRPRLTLGGALLVAGGNACAQESVKPEA
jgi:pimeloyl-ACP methyl ester carboxylesterase